MSTETIRTVGLLVAAVMIALTGWKFLVDAQKGRDL